LKSTLIVRGIAAVAVAAGVAAVSAGAASAASSPAGTKALPVKYVKFGSYQFASNNGVTWRLGGSPVVTPEASQSFGSGGVTLSIAPDQGGPYADSGVIVPLGHLSGLFSNGSYVAPKIVASANTSVNYYFDTDGNGGFLSFSSNDVYVGPAGDNLASISGDNADFSTFSQGNSSLGLTGSMTMEQVLAAFQGRTDGGTTDPEVWAWIGISGSSQATATVTSVDGRPLTAKVLPVLSRVTAAPICNALPRRHWLITNVAGNRAVSVTYYATHSGHAVRQGTVKVQPGHAAAVTTHGGTAMAYKFSNGRSVKYIFVRAGHTAC